MAFFLAHAAAALGIPAKPSYFTQRVDHFSTSAATYQQRFYLNETVFGGAGHPILFIIGGEGAVPPTTGFFYPFIVDILAPKFKALVVEPEHRFYGTSLPDYNVSALQLLTPQQALADAATLILAMQKRYNCGAHGTPTYCPVITIGGSYPGWLSAMMRLRYPGVVDGAYAASAPMNFYAQHVDQYAYYKVITDSAEKAASGCANAVRTAMRLIAETSDIPTLSQKLRLCSPLPSYMASSPAATQIELVMIIAVAFAGLNMGNYPPGPSSRLTKACGTFLDGAKSGTEAALWEALKTFLGGYGGARFRQGHGLVLEPSSPSSSCFNVSTRLPATPAGGGFGTFSCGDWSGCGYGENGLSCVPASTHAHAKRTPSSPFPAAPSFLSWRQKQCVRHTAYLRRRTLVWTPQSKAQDPLS